MNNFYNLVKKEMKELITRQMIISLVFMVVMFGMMGKFIGGVTQEEKKPIETAILDLDKTLISHNFIENMAQLENVRISIINEDSIEKAIEKTKEREGKALLVVPQGFGKDIEEIKGVELEIYSILKGLSIGEVVSSGTLGQIINTINRKMALALKVILYLIPFSHPTIAAKALIFHDYLPVIGGMAYMALFAAVAMYVCVRIFNTDKILTARFSFRKRKRGI